MIFHFLTEYPTILEVNNKDFKIFNTKHLNIDDFDVLTIKCFPLNTTLFKSYSFCLTKTKNNIEISNKNIKTCKLGNNEIFIVLPTFYADQSLLYNKDEITIKNGITLYYNNAQILNERFCAIYCEHKKFEEYDLFLLKGTKENLIIAMFNSNIEFVSKYSQIEIYEDKILLVENLYDMFNHGMVKEYSLNNNLLSKTNEYSVYLLDKVDTFKNTKLIVCAFLECGRAKNINLAKNFLSNNLNPHFSQKNFDDYFEDFKNYYVVKILDNSQKVILEYNNNICLFDFKLQENFIIDIEKIPNFKNF